MAGEIDLSTLRLPTKDEHLQRLDRMQKGSPAPTSGKGGLAVLTNLVAPVDLYCYLMARFGPPNGFVNFLKNPGSDNLIHWHYELRYGVYWMDIMGFSAY